MNTENKVISIAVGDRLQIEGVGTVELVVVAPEQFKGHTKEQAMKEGGEWCECHTDLVMDGKWVAAYKGYWYSHLEGKLKTLNADQKLKMYHSHSFTQSYFSQYFNNPIDFSKPEQSKQHPLVGKWVRATSDNESNNVKEGVWYPVEGLDKKSRLMISTGCLSDDAGWLNPEKQFDLSNPCDFDCNMPEAVNPKYKVGDEVVVVDNGCSFTTHKEAFWFLGLKNKKNNHEFQNKTKATIFSLCRRENGKESLYALRDSEGNECVIGEEGIKLAGIDKQEWLDAASKLFDSWMRISGGYVPNGEEKSYTFFYQFKRKLFRIASWTNTCEFPYAFETAAQAEQFLRENEKDLKAFFHQV